MRAQDLAAQVDLDRAPPGFDAALRERPERPEDAGIVDQRVEPSEAAVDLGDRRRHAIGIGDVAGQRQRVVRLLKRRRRARLQLALDVEQRNAPALSQKAFCGREPNAARGAGNECDFLRGRIHLMVQGSG